MAEVRYYQSISKPGVYSIAVLAGLFGLLCLVAFLDRLPHAGGDEWVMLAIGLVSLLGTGLFLRFTLGPYLVLEASRLRRRTFFRTVSVPYHDLTKLSVEKVRIEPRDARGRRLARGPLLVEKLKVEKRSGQTVRMTLPAFGSNQSLLEELAARSNLSIQKGEERESPERL